MGRIKIWRQKLKKNAFFLTIIIFSLTTSVFGNCNTDPLNKNTYDYQQTRIFKRSITPNLEQVTKTIAKLIPTNASASAYRGVIVFDNYAYITSRDGNFLLVFKIH